MNRLDILGYFAFFMIIGVCMYMYYEKKGFDLKCIVSEVDGNKYCVRERSKIKKAADILALVSQKCAKLVDYVYEKHPNKENVKRLKEGFNPKQIMEILPTSTYTAYSENKGEKVAFCLNKNSKGDHDNDNIIDEHTLTFVAIHELSHIATESIGHKSEFWENFKFLLEEAKSAGIHEPSDYKKKPQEYCGMKISDNPYYDA
jgi:hypothetical protein